jgi:DnaJ-domain-containing protein 1
VSAAPINIKLQCRSWQQLQNIYRRDLSRHAIFLKSSNPPPVGTPIRLDLTLPTESMIVLTGHIAEHVPPGGLGGRGPGIDIKLATIPQSALWLIETALASAQRQVVPPPAGSAAAGAPTPQPATDAGIDDSRDLMRAEDELIAALTAELVALRRLNPFQVMGVGYDADASSVRAAFAELTKRYHPDRFTRYTSTDVRQLAAEIFILIRDAYRRLADDATRARTLASLGLRPSVKVPSRAEAPSLAPAPPASPAAPPSRAAGLAPTQRARTAPPAGSIPPALSSAIPEPIPGEVQLIPSGPTGAIPVGTSGPIPVGTTGGASRPSSRPPPAGAPPPRASTSDPARRASGPISVAAEDQRPDFRAAEGLLESGRYDEALAVFKNFARKNPGDRHARAGMELAEGLRALAQRDRLEAAQRFEAVLEIDPTNERAARELAEMRRMATNERKGLLSRLMGKKE